MTSKTLTTAALTALTTASLLFNAHAQDITTGLVGHWNFDEGSGTTVNDTSGLGNNGTLAGTPSWTTGGWFNDALLFNPGDTVDAVVVPNSASMNFDAASNGTLAFTLAAWVNLSESSQISGAAIFNKGYGGKEQYELDLYTSAEFRFYVRNSAGTASANVVGSANTSNTNTWQHVAVTYSGSGGTMVLYVNGVQKSSGAGPTSLFTTTSNVFIGNRWSSVSSGLNSQVHGRIDDARIYNRALAAADVFMLYTNNAYAPIISEQPQSATATVGQTATFWVSANGLPTLSYQWQSNSAPIAGATSAVYTTPALTSSADQATYNVVVTSSFTNLSTTSSSATLTVSSNTPPTVSSAAKSAANANNVVVVYSEPVSSATALNTANYLLNGVNPTSAAAGSQANQVVLTMASPLNSTTAYSLAIANVQDLSGNTIVATTVPVFAANMALWLRADAGVVKDAGGNVAQWLDQSANANNLAQFPGGPSLQRPGFLASSMSGKPALSFASKNLQYVTAPSSPTLAITADMSIFVVANVADYGASRTLVSKAKSNQPAPYDYYAGKTLVTLLRGNGTVNGSLNSFSLPSAGAPHLFSALMAGTAVSHYADAKTNGTGTISTTIADTGAPLYIGARDEFGTIMNGSISEVMIFSQALTGSDLTNVNLYLGARYFPLAVTTRPRNVACFTSETAVFTAAINPVTLQPVTYTWTLNNGALTADAVGQGTPTLTITNAGAADAGTYTLTISNPMGTTNLTAALTVNTMPAADYTDNLVGWWKFDDASGSATAADASGNANPGALAGFADATHHTMWTSGLIGGAMAFNADGTGSNVVAVPSVGTAAPAVLNFAANPAFTLAAWVKGNTTQTNGGAVIAEGAGNGGEQYTLDCFSSGRYRFYVRDTNGLVYTAQTALAPSGIWQHVAAVLDATNGTMKVYTNGVLAVQAIAPLSLITNNSPMNIGNRQPGTNLTAYGNAFTGLIDDVRVYSRALTSADIAALLAAPEILATSSNAPAFYVGSGTPAYSVTALGAATLYYQWYTNGVPVSGANSSSYTLPGAASAQPGIFTNYCIVTNSVGAATTAVWTVTFVAQPTDNYGSTVFGNNNPGMIAWWRLTEPASNQAGGNPGAVAYDYIGGHDCVYANALLAQPGYSPVLQTNTAALFGVYAASNSYAGEIDASTYGVTNITFAQAAGAGANAEFSVEAWVKLTNTITAGAAIVAKGYGNGGEQFDLDVAPQFRFFYRDAAGNVHGPTSSIIPIAGQWYHVVGVADAQNGAVHLYVNGVDVADTTGIATGLGVLTATAGSLPGDNLVSIGARTSSKTVTAYDLQFQGDIADVVLYNYALSATQVGLDYQASSVPPAITSSTPPVTPTNLVTTLAGASASFSLTASGTTPLAYQWYTNGVPVSGATSTNDSFTGLAAGFLTNSCIVSNLAGTATNTWLLDVLPAPTNPFPQKVLSLAPVGYWRLNEVGNGLNNGNAGVACVDSVGGHDGVYNNVNLGITPGYSTTTDPNETAAQFGVFASANSYVGGIQGVSFPAPTGSNVNFSIVAWVRPNTTQINAAQMLSQGEYGYDDMFELAVSSGSPWYYRFLSRNHAGTVNTVTSTLHPDGNWHLLVGVCDETHAIQVIYIDGISNNAITIPTAAGLYTAANTAVILGAGTSTGTGYNQQYTGPMSDVAFFNYALTADQARQLWNATGQAPLFTLPTAITVDQGATVVLTATVTAGTAPLSYSWYDNNIPAVILGQTTNTLVITNIQASDTYTLTVSNAYGAPAVSCTVNVVAGCPQFGAGGDITLLNDAVYAGTPVTYSVTAYGTLPLYYQWFNGAAPIPNATNAAYTVTTAQGANTYSCIISNGYAGGCTLSSSTATLVGAPLPISLYALTVLSNNPVAYWRLDEPDNTYNNGNYGSIAYDYAGGHNATYYNAELSQAGYNPSDPDWAALFGVYATGNSYAGEIDNSASGIPTVNFAKTLVGGNAQFSVEAWVKTTNSQSTGAGILAKGWNGGGEQFALDCTGNQFRFYFRTINLSIITCQSAVSVNDGLWHHLVGVCDQLHGTAHIYVDGNDDADTYNGGGTGVTDPSGATDAATDLVSIGARAASRTAGTLANQFIGTIDEVALYTNALTAAQVLQHYTVGITNNLVPQVTLSITNLGNGSVELDWNYGTLQGADAVPGTFNDITNVSPYVVPATNAAQFYRVRGVAR